jgi:uroporphyrinogen-III synthase
MNLRVLVTRPMPQGERLCEKIRAIGGSPIYLPTLEIIPPKDPILFQQQVSELKQFDYLIFISPQAVIQSVPLIREYGFPASLKIIAVGAGTAEALQEAGFSDVLFPKEDWRTEGLLALAQLQQVTAKKIAVVRGEGGRELLINTLLARGAMVTSIIAYQRQLPQTDVEEYVKLLKAGVIDSVVSTSNDSLQNLFCMLGEENKLYLQALPLLVVSERIATCARALGFKKIIVAANARDESILEALVQSAKQFPPF